MVSNLELSELIAVKLCHDLAGPIGAINNGLELLQDADEVMAEQAIDLATSSAKSAVARMQFYRQAYGKVNNDALANIDSIMEIINNFYSESKLTIKWEITNLASIDIANQYIKILLNAVLMISNLMVYGGQISINLQKKGSKTFINIDGNAPNMKENALIEEMFSKGLDNNMEINVKNVQPYLLYTLTKDAGCETKISITNNSVKFTIG